MFTGTRRRDHTTSSVLRELHWLPIRERVKFKVECPVRQSLSGQAPMVDDWCLVSDSTRRSMRSTDVPTAWRRTQQLRRQNFYSRWTSRVELSSGPAAQSRHHLRTVQTTDEGIPLSASTNYSELIRGWQLNCTLYQWEAAEPRDQGSVVWYGVHMQSLTPSFGGLHCCYMHCSKHDQVVRAVRVW